MTPKSQPRLKLRAFASYSDPSLPQGNSCKPTGGLVLYKTITDGSVLLWSDPAPHSHGPTGRRPKRMAGPEKALTRHPNLYNERIGIQNVVYFGVQLVLISGLMLLTALVLLEIW